MNLIQIHSALMFIIAIPLTDGKSKNNINVPTDFRLSANHMIPIHYKVKLIFQYISVKDDNNKTIPSFIIDEDDTLLYGDCEITINILQLTQNVTLHVLNVHSEIYGAKLIKSDGLIYENEGQATYGSEADNLVILFNDTLLPDLYYLKLRFWSTKKNGKTTYDNAEGFFKTFHLNEDGSIAWLLATHIKTFGTRQLFPCWNDPQIRATFAISIGHPPNSTALFNMPVQTLKTLDSVRWSYFYTTPPISTYHIAIAVTNYNYTRINKNITLWCRTCSTRKDSRRKDTFEYAKLVIKNVTSYLASEFEKIKIPKVDHVAIPNFPQDGISKWGLIFYREADVIYSKNVDSIMSEIEIARLIAYKIAYQWFGTAVNPSRWSYFWLHDGLATIYGEEAVVKTFNKSEIMDFLIVQNQYESLHLDSYFNMNPPQIKNLLKINSLFSFPHYIKVPIVLRMLQNAMTNDLFRIGVRAYLDKYIFNSVTLDEFWFIQEDISKTYGSYSQLSKEFLNWISYRYYPVLSWRKGSPFHGTLTQYFNTSSYGKWWMSTDLITKSRAPYSYSMKVWLTPQTPNWSYFGVDIQDNWAMVDIKQAGYYRVNYESEDWQKIAHYLNSEKYKNINVINRAKIIDDAFHFTIARQLNISMFWDLANYLRQETDYVAWYPMIKMFEYVSNVIPFEDQTSIMIKRKLNDLLNNHTKRYSEHSQSYITKSSLSQEILKWACTLHHASCLATAKEMLLLHLKDSQKTISPGLKKWTYCNGLLQANIIMWDYIKNRWLKNDHELLPYLACTRDPSIVLEHLPYVLENSYTNGTQDTAIIRSSINIFHSIIARHANRYFDLTNILSNFEKIKPKEISKIVAVTDIINHVYSEMNLIEINNQLGHLIYGKSTYSDDLLLLKVQFKINIRFFQIRNQTDYFGFIYGSF